MRNLLLVVACVLFLEPVRGRGGQCDVYVANVGCGNCICVRFSAEEGEGERLRRLQRGLWVDCGAGSRGLVPGGSEDLDGAVEKFFWGEESAIAPLPPKNVMLWITHLHRDHIDKVQKINKGPVRGTKEDRGIGVGFAIVGVGAGENLLPKDVGENSAVAEIWKEIRERKTIEGVQVWGGKEKRRKSIDSVCRYVNMFWGDFPHENNGIKLKPLIPSAEYGKKKRKPEGKHTDAEEVGDNASDYEDNLEPNDTSLVLGLEYYGVKMLFPGDAPGTMYGCLEEEDRSFVENVDILIAPHHGSGGNHEGAWYSSNRRFCTIISGDPGAKGVVLDLGSFGSRDSSTCLEEQEIRYSNPAKKGTILKSKSQKPTLCTAGDGKKKLVGYHIKIDSDKSRKKIDRIKLYEILFDENGNKRYREDQIKIQEIPDPQARQGQLSICPGDTYTLADQTPPRHWWSSHISAFVGIASFLLGGFCGAVLWAASH